MPLTKWLINRGYFGHLELDQPYLGDLLPLGIKERIRCVQTGPDPPGVWRQLERTASRAGGATGWVYKVGNENHWF